jgi:phasin family protein
MSETSKGTRSGASAQGTSSNKASSAGEERKKNESAGSAWAQYTKGFEKIPAVEMEALMKSHDKNMDTVRHAQETAAELLQNLMNINNQYVRSSFDELSTQIRTASEEMGEPFSPGAAAAPAFVKASFDRAIAHCKQVTDLFSQSTAKVFNCYRKRFDEGLTEAKVFVRN